MKPPPTVDVACPRCDVPVICTLETRPLNVKPGEKVRQLSAHVPDLAEKFAAHYEAAGHVDVVAEVADKLVMIQNFNVVDTHELARAHGVKIAEDEGGRRG